MNPTAFYDVAQLALDCVCDQMTSVALDLEGYPGCPCRAYVSAGSAAFDNCCDGCGDPENHGQLTVEIVDVFQSDNFPSTGAVIHPCKASSWVAQILVTVARCAPSMDEQGNPPSAEDLDANALLTATDLWAVLQGLVCCLPSQPVPGKTKRRVQIANAGNTTLAAEGGCAAVEVRAYVEVGNVCGCTEGS